MWLSLHLEPPSGAKDGRVPCSDLLQRLQGAEEEWGACHGGGGTDVGAEGWAAVCPADKGGARKGVCEGRGAG